MAVLGQNRGPRSLSRKNRTLPHLLRDRAIEGPNQGQVTDITPVLIGCSVSGAATPLAWLIDATTVRLGRLS